MEKKKGSPKTEQAILKNSDNLLLRLTKYSFLLFVIGLCVDIIFYIHNGQLPVVWIDAVSIAIFIVAFIFFILKKLSTDTSMLIVLSTVVLNLCLTMILQAFLIVPDAAQSVLLAMGVSFIPVIMVWLTLHPYYAIVYIILCMGSYVFAAIKLDDAFLLQRIPVLLLLQIGAAILSSYIMEMTRRVERDRLSAEVEWDRLVEFLHLDKEQKEALKNGYLTNKDVSKLMSRMSENVQELILQHAKTVVHDDQNIVNALKQKHSTLTAGELELCCMIVKGHSAGDISRIRGVGVSTVTSTRSRLRQKIALPERESLRSYLESVVNENISV